MRQVSARAPTRIDFVGGWTDVQPFCDEEAGLVINAALNVPARVTVRESQSVEVSGDPFIRAACRRFRVENVRVELTSDAPVGSGLGGSGTVGVALVGALAAYAGRELSRGELAELAHRIEVEDLGIIGGKQDQYAAVYGGFLELTFLGESVQVEPLELDPTFLKELQARSIVVYTGQSRMSGNIHAQVQENFKQHNPDTLKALATIRAAARAFRDALEQGAVGRLGELLDMNWQAQKKLHGSTTNARVDSFFEVAQAAGALGGRALGAGGGGCLYLLAPEGGRLRIENTLRAEGGEILAVEFDLSGVQAHVG